MKILVDKMPNNKKACLFYSRYKQNLIGDYCKLNNKPCSFKNGESIFGGECRCLKVGLTRE